MSDGDASLVLWGVFGRGAREPSFRQALVWSAVWIALALVFAGGIWALQGGERALTYFRVPRPYRHRVLIWGVIGAIVMRAALIAAGLAVVHAFAWMEYVLGAFLIFLGARMAFYREEAIDPEDNPVPDLGRRR